MAATLTVDQQTKAARDMAGMIRQRAAHGIREYRILLDELPVAAGLDSLAAELERLELANAEMRAALEKIAGEFQGRPGEFDQSHDVVSHDVKRIARDAIAKE